LSIAETVVLTGLYASSIRHGLASVLKFIDPQTAAEADEDYDWTIASSSRVVGCKAPDGAIYSEFRCLNDDETDRRYNSPLGMYQGRCGLEKAILTWTGPEYMYHMLNHNGVDVPEEGLAILRLFSLRDWHTKREYGILANENDEDVQTFVADFDELRRDARKQLHHESDLSDEDCDVLWNTHYSHIVSKYCADGLLKW
jgi:hypothetical protein